MRYLIPAAVYRFLQDGKQPLVVRIFLTSSGSVIMARILMGEPQRLQTIGSTGARSLRTPWRSAAPMRPCAPLSRQEHQRRICFGFRVNPENQGASASNHPAQVLPHEAYRPTFPGCGRSTARSAGDIVLPWAVGAV